LTILYDQYSGALFGIIQRTIRDQGFAEDILQQAFVKIWNAIDQYDESRGTLFTWMSTIARNLALDLRRLKSFEARNKTDDVDTIVYSNEAITQAPGSEKVDVARLLNTMDDKYRVILELMYLQGYSQAEIAELIDIPLGTVKTRAKKAIDILRDVLKDEKSLFAGNLGLLLLLASQAEMLGIFGS
jgi:RNA polymerase sigma-70 factor (ECF subfamily)